MGTLQLVVRHLLDKPQHPQAFAGFHIEGQARLQMYAGKRRLVAAAQARPVDADWEAQEGEARRGVDIGGRARQRM